MTDGILYLTTAQAALALGISEGSLARLVYGLKLKPASGAGPVTWTFSQETIERRKQLVERPHGWRPHRPR